MAERRDSQFQPNAPFTCTGKIAGLLYHRIMMHAPGFIEDYIFIIVPDDWTFPDRAMSIQTPATQFPLTTPKHPTADSSDYINTLARFTSTKKEKLLRPHPTDTASI